MLFSGVAASAGAADLGTPLRMKLEVTDGKTCPPPNARTELRFRVPGEASAEPAAVAQTQGDTPASVALLSYCPANAEPRSVVHTAYYVGEESAEPNVLTATMRRAAQPMPIRGKLVPPRPAAKRATAHLFSAEGSP
jgi:hypothetical protein